MVGLEHPFEGGAEGFDACQWINAEVASHLAQAKADDKAATRDDGGEPAGDEHEHEHGHGHEHEAGAEDELGSVAKYLGELEVKMQLVADDVSAKIEETAKATAEKLPAARKEMQVLKEQAGTLQEQIFSILGNIRATQSSVGNSMGNIQLMDRVQTNMTLARDALSEASGLAQLLATVEQTFKQGDLPTIARQLKQIRESLESVKGVPEFSGVEVHLHEFEERLQTMIQSPLQKAFEDHDAKAVKNLSEILLMIGRSDIVGTLFVAAKIFKLQSSWESFSPLSRASKAGGGEVDDAPDLTPVSFSAWLPKWLDGVLSVTKSEYQWCLENLQDQAESLIVTLLETCFVSIKQSFKNRLQTEMSTAMALYDAGDSDEVPLKIVMELKESLAGFMDAVQSALAPSSPGGNQSTQDASGHASPTSSKLEGVTLCVFGQMKDQIAMYAMLEKQQMSKCMKRLSGDLLEPSKRLVPSSIRTTAELADIIESCAQAMLQATSPASQACQDALVNCTSLTGGTKVFELLAVMDGCLANYISRVISTAQKVRRTVQDCIFQSIGGVDGPSGNTGPAVAFEQVGDAVPEDVLASILKLLQATSVLSNSVSLLEANLHSSLTALKPQWQEEGHEIHTLFKLFPGEEKAFQKQASSLIGASTTSLLPTTGKHASDLEQSTHELVLDSMMIKVKQSLQGLPESSAWSKLDAKDKTFDLPSFSAFPSKHVTDLGEYLLVLPQQFELLDHEVQQQPAEQLQKAEESATFASEWMCKVVCEGLQMYTREVMQIPRLSENGCSQLQADVDYLRNVLQALLVPVPLSVSTIADCLSISSAEECRNPSRQPANCDMSTWTKLVQIRLAGENEKGNNSRVAP